MKTTKLVRRSLLLLALGSALLAPALSSAADDTQPPPPPPAQGPGPRGGMFNPEKRLARLTERLGLTAEQQAKILPILQAQAAEMKALDNTALTQEQRREKMKAIHQDDRFAIAAILTPEQRKLLAEMRHEMRGPRGERGERPESTPPAN